MRITAITIENFKSISGPLSINIKPITLLFGPNSSGKSSVIQAIHYAYEVFVRRNLDPDRTIPGGDQLDLGGFRNLIHDRDLDSEMILRFDLDLEGDELPIHDEYLATRWQDGNFEEDDSCPFDAIHLVTEVWIEIHIRWTNLFNAPIVTSYSIGINDEFFSEISSSIDGKDVYLSKINLDHEVFQRFYKFEDDEDSSDTQENSSGQAAAIPQGVGVFFSQFDLDILISGIEEPDGKSIIRSIFPLHVGLEGMRMALPEFGRDLIFDKESLAEHVGGLRSWVFCAALSTLIVGPGQKLMEALREFVYLGPMRAIPERFFTPAKSFETGRWASGLAAWDILEKASEAFLAEVNEWLCAQHKLNTGYVVERVTYKELNVKGGLHYALMQGRALDDDWVIQELRQLPERQRMFLREIVDGYEGIEVMPQDIGIGISQILPVAVLALEPRTVHSLQAIEQPELHIHPALQVGLGDLFISQVLSKAISKTFLIETHSEHLLLRILRRIREKTNGELPDETLGLAPNHLGVYFFESLNGESQVSSIQVDEDGEFLDKWPRGFFDERAKELF